MGKINCNDGCLDNYSGECVKYTGAALTVPNIPQNTNLNAIINIFANLRIHRPDILIPQDNASLNTAYASADIGTRVICSSINLIYEKLTATTWFSYAITLLS